MKTSLFKGMKNILSIGLSNKLGVIENGREIIT
jgi:hypothetical protein